MSGDSHGGGCRGVNLNWSTKKVGTRCRSELRCWHGITQMEDNRFRSQAYQKLTVLLVGGAVDVVTTVAVATAGGATVPPACTTMTVAAGAAVAPGDGDCATRNRTFT